MKMKQTEVGLIPDDWEVKEIKDFADVTTGDKNTQDAEENGKYPFYVRSPIVERINKFSYDTEGVITAGDGVGTGKVFHYAKGKFGLHQRAYLIYNFKNTDPKYFYYNFSKNFYERVHSMTAKSSVDSVRREMITKMQIPIPPTLAEQQRIAKALSDVDALISTTEKLIKKKKNIKQGAMQNLLTGKKRLPGFGDKQTDLFVPNGTHTKEVKDVNPEQIRLSAKMKQTELGEIPEDWEVKGFGAYASIVRGGSPRPIQNFLTTNSDGINWIKIGDVKPEDKYIVSTEEKIIPEGKSRSREVHKGDFILSNSMSFGRPYILQIDGCIHDGWLAIQNYQDTFDTDFLYYLLGSDEIFKQYIEMAAGSSVQNLNKEKVAKLLVPIFDKEEQTAIANVLSSMDKEIEILNTKLEKYRNLKTAMMQQLLTGKIRLVK